MIRQYQFIKLQVFFALCGRPKRPHYGSCLSVSVRPSCTGSSNWKPKGMEETKIGVYFPQGVSIFSSKGHVDGRIICRHWANGFLFSPMFWQQQEVNYEWSNVSSGVVLNIVSYRMAFCAASCVLVKPQNWLNLSGCNTTINFDSIWYERKADLMNLNCPSNRWDY